MKKLLLAALVLAPVMALAAADDMTFSGFFVQGNHDSASFVVRPTSNRESWNFTIPDGEYYWLKTIDAQGNELEDTDLSDHDGVTLVNAMGKKVTFTIYEIAGNGPWSARKAAVDGTADEVSFGGGGGSNDYAGMPDQMGTLSAGDTSAFTVTAQSDPENWVFTWPDDGRFFVKVLGKTGKKLGDYDLDNGNTITLTGGGTFTLKVYSKSGSGRWTATRSE